MEREKKEWEKKRRRRKRFVEREGEADGKKKIEKGKVQLFRRRESASWTEVGRTVSLLWCARDRQLRRE